MNIRDCFIMLVHVAVAVRIVQGKLVDIRKEVSNIIAKHNHERGDKQLKASDMLEMRWDVGLAGRAGDYADRCTYQWPPLQEFDVGSNLYYEVDFVHGPKSVRRLVNTAFRAWTMQKKAFTFGFSLRKCLSLRATQSNQVGCAMSTCPRLSTGSIQETHASLFVCFYSPRTNLLDSFPFKYGFACAQCPASTICRYGLCTSPDMEAVPSFLQESFLNSSTKRKKTDAVDDGLSDTEKYYLTSGHNRLRETSSKDPVEWDPYLEKWAKWIISCTTDYPGPEHTYTNFERLDQGDQVYTKIYDWSTEGEVVNLQLVHGCRTPFDSARCNHFTNIRQPMLTSIACAAKDCKDGTRQLVCIYDNKVDRVYRSSGYTYDSRANRRSNRKRRSISRP